MATYYASKAYVLNFTEALSYELRGTGVTATVLCPGATATEFAQVAGIQNAVLFRSSAEAASVARYGYRAMMKGKTIAIPGLWNKLSQESLRVSPRSVLRGVAGWLNKP
jgi:uncharacterized protein